MDYHDELCAAMVWLSQRPNVYFFGQGVGCPGTGMSSTFRNVPMTRWNEDTEKEEPIRIEMPVAEEMQMGMCVGIAVRKRAVPVCIFPRWNFVLRAADQLVNHLDRLPIYSAGEFKPGVVIRVAVPSKEPFDPQSQHDADLTSQFYHMLRTVNVLKLEETDDIQIYYERAYTAATLHGASTILVEYSDKYRNERGKNG
jgi:pyruvate/2-oxoglutarate/acetoin dehydrogenase E1 component